MQASMPELPSGKRRRYADMGLPRADVLLLTDDVASAAYFEAVVDAGAPPKAAANWILGDIGAHCNVRETLSGSSSMQAALCTAAIRQQSRERQHAATRNLHKCGVRPCGRVASLVERVLQGLHMPNLYMLATTPRTGRWMLSKPKSMMADSS